MEEKTLKESLANAIVKTEVETLTVKELLYKLMAICDLVSVMDNDDNKKELVEDVITTKQFMNEICYSLGEYKNQKSKETRDYEKIQYERDMLRDACEYVGKKVGYVLYDLMELLS